MRRVRLAFCGFVVALLASFDVACADPCQTILEEFKTLSDRANREVESTVANLREAVSDVRDDKTRIALIARSCVAAAEALGFLSLIGSPSRDVWASRQPVGGMLSMRSTDQSADCAYHSTKRAGDRFLDEIGSSSSRIGLIIVGGQQRPFDQLTRQGIGDRRLQRGDRTGAAAVRFRNRFLELSNIGTRGRMRRRKPTADLQATRAVLCSRGAPHTPARPAGRDDVPPAAELTLRSCQTRAASAAAAAFNVMHPIGTGGGNRPRSGCTARSSRRTEYADTQTCPGDEGLQSHTN